MGTSFEFGTCGNDRKWRPGVYISVFLMGEITVFYVVSTNLFFVLE